MQIKYKKYIIVIPTNVKVFISLNALKSTNFLWLYVNYPNLSEYIVCYNMVAYSAVITKFLPFFIIHFIKNHIQLIFPFINNKGKSKSIIYHSLSLMYKTIVLISFGYPRLLQFVGFRFRQRWFISGQAIRLRLGYNRKVWVKCPDDFVMFIKKITPKKRNHVLFSFDKHHINELVGFLLIARSASLYKGRGINIREKPMQLKEGKKTLW